MKIKNIVAEDFVNYKKPSMFIGTISCNGKCCIEANIPLSVCQNDTWRTCKVIAMPNDVIINLYKTNPITSSIVFGGLEPMEQFEELYTLINDFRINHDIHDDIVIYTGYYIDEINDYVESLKNFDNIIIKFGRYIPNKESRYDEVLGVTLSSDNQYAERIS